MSNTVQQFAAELKKSVPTLLEQLKAAGVEKSSGADSISPADKQALLAHLRKQNDSGTVSISVSRTRTERSTCMSECCDALGKHKEAALQARILRQICPHRHRLRILCARQIGIVPKPRVNVLVHERRIVDLGAGSTEFH